MLNVQPVGCILEDFEDVLIVGALRRGRQAEGKARREVGQYFLIGLGGGVVGFVDDEIVEGIRQEAVQIQRHALHAGADQSKKGNQWHFGYKAHIGADTDTGLIHTLETTAGNVSDVSMTSKLLTGTEEEVNGDAGYVGANKRKGAITRNRFGKKIKYRICRRPSTLKKLSRSGQYKARKAEYRKSSVRCKVEHVFGVVKNLFRCRMTRYRGKAKVDSQLKMVFALANLFLADTRYGLQA